ncbi:spore coat protein [Bacillus salacetis]|uniref:Spore coat protein n=1 Tax=Bacillus salacetis TaxID=2315464 RepID=A0A3A1QQJ3_9BACI|nr:spore coat protein [Bacillus salacetis]RIW29385.1 spore coat protein [Bacillus salacetis]
MNHNGFNLQDQRVFGRPGFGFGGFGRPGFGFGFGRPFGFGFGFPFLTGLAAGALLAPRPYYYPYPYYPYAPYPYYY